MHASVTNLVLSERRNALGATISSGLTLLLIGVAILPIASNAAASLPVSITMSAKKGMLLQMRVSTPPGAMALTRMPSGAHSFAAMRASWITAALEAP